MTASQLKWYGVPEKEAGEMEEQKTEKQVCVECGGSGYATWDDSMWCEHCWSNGIVPIEKARQ